MQPFSEEHLQSELCAFITSMVGRPCAPHDELSALGLDSIGFLEVVIFLERTLHIPLPLELMTSQPLSTVAALATRVTTLPSQAGKPNG
jgi:hypothetical protein